MLSNTILPSSADADGSLVLLRDILAAKGEVSVESAEGAAVLPAAVRALLVDAVEALVAGHAVTVEPQRTILTTQEAADILGVTRPTFVRLLTSGQISYTTPGRHRRVELADVLKFQQQARIQRRQVLEQMAEESTEDPVETAGVFFETR